MFINLNRFKTSRLAKAISSLFLDFTATNTLDDRVTFSRTSNATVTNSNGLIAYAPNNLFTFSEQFDNAAWGKSGVTVTANTTLAPDNTTTADTVTNTNGVDSSRITVAPTLVSGTTYTFTINVRAGTASSLMFGYFAAGAFTAGTASIVSGSGSVSGTTLITVSGLSATAWTRISFVFTVGTSGTFFIYPETSGVGTGKSIILWGAQLEIGSTATTYNPTTSTAYYGPRFDYNPVTLQPRGLLIEGQRTNLLLQSEAFDTASWTKIRASATANTTISPDGTQDADKIVEDTTASATHVAIQAASVISGTAYTFSFYLKSAERVSVLGSMSSSFPANSDCVFNASTGIATNVLATSVSMTLVGNGWYRCTMTATANATGSANFTLYLRDASSIVYTGNGTSGLFIWGAQVEAGAFATSYIPTAASQVTRTVDTALITGTNFSSWYNSTEGTIYTTTELPSSFTSFTNAFIYMFDRNTGSLGPRIQLAANPALQTQTSAVVNDSSSVVAQLVGTGSRTALAYKVNDFAQSVNGASSASDTSGALPTGIIALRIGSNSTNATSLNGHIKQITYYNTRLPNETLQALTS